MSAEQSTTEIVEYREVPGGNGCYRAGTDGSVWTRYQGGRKGDYPWKLMKPVVREDQPYPRIRLKRYGRLQFYWLHRVILETFVGQRPEKMECRHLNGNPMDNRLINLVWGTSRDNHADLFHHRTQQRRPYVSAKMTVDVVVESRKLAARGSSITKLARRFGVDASTLVAAVRGISWRWLPGAVPPVRTGRSPDSYLKPIRRSVVTPTMESVIHARFAAGTEIGTIARELGISYTNAWQYTKGARGMDKRVRAILEEV